MPVIVTGAGATGVPSERIRLFKSSRWSSRYRLSPPPHPTLVRQARIGKVPKTMLYKKTL
jgi:hypothetical protein